MKSGMPNDKRVLVLLWSAEPGFEGWIFARGGRDLGADAVLTPDPVVVEALSGVPVNNGLGGGCGRDRLVETLTALHTGGYPLNGPELEEAGAAAGMDLDDLREVRVHADRILKGKAFKVRHPMYRPDVVEVWKDSARTPDPAS